MELGVQKIEPSSVVLKVWLRMIGDALRKEMTVYLLVGDNEDASLMAMEGYQLHRGFVYGRRVSLVGVVVPENMIDVVQSSLDLVRYCS